MAEFDTLAGIADELKIGLSRGYPALMVGAKLPINVGGELVYVDPDPKYILQCVDLATRAIRASPQGPPGHEGARRVRG